MKFAVCRLLLKPLRVGTSPRGNRSLRKTTVASAVLGVFMRFIKEMVPQFRIPYFAHYICESAFG